MARAGPTSRSPEQVDARAYLRPQIGSTSGLKDTSEEDTAYNAAQSGQIDLEDLNSTASPHQIGPGKVADKDYQNRLILRSEP